MEHILRRRERKKSGRGRASGKQKRATREVTVASDFC